MYVNIYSQHQRFVAQVFTAFLLSSWALLFLPYLTPFHSGLYDISPLSWRAYKISRVFTVGKFENISRLLQISFTTLLLSLSAISLEAEISLQSMKFSSTENFTWNVEQTLSRSHTRLTSCAYVLLKMRHILKGTNDKQYPIYLFFKNVSLYMYFTKYVFLSYFPISSFISFIYSSFMCWL